jgi:hypothetical protein
LKDPVAVGSAQEFRDFIKVFAAQSSPQQLASVGRQYLKSASDQAARLLFAWTETEAD